MPTKDWPHKCPYCGKNAAADYCSVKCKIGHLETINAELLAAIANGAELEPEPPAGVDNDSFQVGFAAAFMYMHGQAAIANAQGER